MFEAATKILGASFERAPWGWAVLVAIVGGYFRLKPLMIRLANEREANLLSERAQEMTTMREELSLMKARLDHKDVQHEAERSYDRHRINNLATSLNSFLLLVKANPKDAATAAATIEEMRARQIEEEKREAIALRDLVAKLTVEKGHTS